MKIAILTCFMEFQSGYSLTGIVQDQVWMLTKYGHEVHLFVNEQYHGASFPADVVLHKKIPFAHLKDYRAKDDLIEEHKETVSRTKKLCLEVLKDFDFIFTHDLVFTGWNMPYALGIQEAAPEKVLENTRWLHWIHSIPSLLVDWWNIKRYGHYHRLVYPNESDRLRVAEQFNGEIADVRVIPHIKDLRSWFDFGKDTCEFIDQHPEVMQADVVQILPASVDRLESKRVREVILIFSKIKKRGFSVCLVIANQWATGTQQKEEVERYKKIAWRNGLRVAKEVVFTSDFKPEYEVGIPKRMVRELFQCSNLFLFPTREESFGLAVPEAALAGGVLLVLNKSLTMQIEISGFTCLYVDFGSYHQAMQLEDEGKYFTDVVQIILGRMRENEAINSKTFCRQKYNVDSLFNKVYAPIMADAETW